MKARFYFAGLMLALQVSLPATVYSADESQWASGHDSFADFWNGVAASVSDVANALTGRDKLPKNEWGSTIGGFDFTHKNQDQQNNQGITIVEGNRTIKASKNVTINATDTSRRSRRLGNFGSSAPAAAVKKLVDGGANSANTFGSYGVSSPIGSGGGYRGGSSSSYSGWGSSTSSVWASKYTPNYYSNSTGRGHMGYGLSGSGPMGSGGSGQGRYGGFASMGGTTN